MTITFDEDDKKDIASKLGEAGISVSNERVSSVLYNVEAALQEQFGPEADFMINEFEV